jgi:hypothetical protein
MAFIAVRELLALRHGAALASTNTEPLECRSKLDAASDVIGWGFSSCSTGGDRRGAGPCKGYTGDTDSEMVRPVRGLDLQRKVRIRGPHLPWLHVKHCDISSEPARNACRPCRAGLRMSAVRRKSPSRLPPTIRWPSRSASKSC